jgi:hypothetical protein
VGLQGAKVGDVEGVCVGDLVGLTEGDPVVGVTEGPVGDVVGENDVSILLDEPKKMSVGLVMTLPIQYTYFNAELEANASDPCLFES